MKRIVSSVWALFLLAPYASAASATVTVRNGDVFGTAGTVVWLVPDDGAVKPAPGEATIEQRNRQFRPHITVVPTGTPVSFPNLDRTRHHVYSFSPAKRFEIKLYAGDPPERIVFDSPGVVVLGCNIHDGMLGYVVVVDSPYFGTVEADGRQALDVPPGGYELFVWTPEFGENPRSGGHVAVSEEGAELRVDLRRLNDAEAGS